MLGDYREALFLLGTASTTLHLHQNSVISSGSASACARAVGAPDTDLLVSELLLRVHWRQQN